MTTPTHLASTDLTSATFKANPFPYYAQLRAEAPVYAMPHFRGQKAWQCQHTRFSGAAVLSCAG